MSDISQHRVSIGSFNNLNRMFSTKYDKGRIPPELRMKRPGIIMLMITLTMLITLANSYSVNMKFVNQKLNYGTLNLNSRFDGNIGERKWRDN